jgi:hypothetical protein
MNDSSDFHNLQAMWDAVDFEEVKLNLPAVTRYVDELRRLFVNGQVDFAAFALPRHPVFDVYADNRQFHDMGFFEHFWKADGPSQVFRHELRELNFFDRGIFREDSPFLLGGSLASILSWGGAYEAFKRGGLEAKRIGEEAALEMLDGNYDDALVFEGHSYWSTYFLDVAWDYAFVVINPGKRLVHTLLATDTD